MNPRNQHKAIALQLKRERKLLKRRRQGRAYTEYSAAITKEVKFRKKIDQVIINRFKCEIHEFFTGCGFLDGTEKTSTLINVNKPFNFRENYTYSLNIIKSFVASIMKHPGQLITIDFAKCKNVDQPALFTLQMIKIQLQEDFRKLNAKLKAINRELNIEVVSSEVEQVNKLLLVAGLIPHTTLKNDGLMPVDSMGFLKGEKSRKHYHENRKGAIATGLVRYLNKCLLNHNFEFNDEGKNELEGLISEVLNNAEDHSPLNSYYATANMLSEQKEGNKKSHVGEINVTILNFGSSFYEGLEQTKEENFETYSDVEHLYNQVTDNGRNRTFTKEGLFTLYALQDGISRLKYERDSGGTGTMKFINSFFAFGDYEDEKLGYKPNLTLISGKTRITCDNKYKPFQREGVNYLSLNSSEDLAKFPSKTHITELNSHFPGTLVTAKIYLNKDHLDKKYKQQAENGKKD